MAETITTANLTTTFIALSTGQANVTVKNTGAVAGAEVGVVHDDVQVTEGIERRLDEVGAAIPGGDVVAVGHGLATHGPDLLDDLAGGTGGPAAPVELGADVVDDDLGPLAGELEGMTAADAPARTRDDDDSTVAERTHGSHLFVLVFRTGRQVTVNACPART